MLFDQRERWVVLTVLILSPDNRSVCVLITITHMMPSRCHGCGDFLCTFHQCLPLEQIQLFVPGLFQSGLSAQSQTLTECIWNVFLCMQASVFNPTNRKVLFPPGAAACQSLYFFFIRRWYLNGQKDLLCGCSEGHPPSLVIHSPASWSYKAPQTLFPFSWRQIIPVHKVRQQFAMCVFV